MNTILNTQEAFAAIQKGKQVLCRYAGNGTLPADQNFMTLDDVPASVFCKPHYEFCIKIEMLEIAGISFTKPCLLDEMKEGQTIFIVELSKNTIVSGVYTLGNTYLDGLISNGVVQRDLYNAKAHLKAFQAAIGIDIEPFITDCDPIFTDKNVPKKTQPEEEVTPPKAASEPKAKRTKAADKKALELQNHATTIMESLKTCKSPIEVSTVCFQLGKYGFNAETINEIEKAKNEKLASFEQVTNAANASTFELTESEAELTQHLDPNEAIYQSKLTELILHVSNAPTVAAAKAVTRYTTSWTDEQRQPLNDQIEKRVQELQKQPEEKTEQPSMIVKILNAVDLTELDALEIDIANLDAMIQPRMMQYVEQRREELQRNEQG